MTPTPPKPVLALQPSEAVVVRAAAAIFAAYITAGKVAEGNEGVWIRKAIREAYEIARLTDEAVQSDSELA